MQWACVWLGNKYGRQYVEHLRRKLPGDLVCLTDRAWDVPDGVRAVDITALDLHGWWGKMALFNPAIRGAGRTVYLDLDTVVVGDLEPLQALELDRFGVCRNFTRYEGSNFNWPCEYGSCCMVFPDGWGGHVWAAYEAERTRWEMQANRYGDQWVIERLVPDAVMLQDVLPKKFFFHKRRLGPVQDPRAALLIFAGAETPENTRHQWVRELWP